MNTVDFGVIFYLPTQQTTATPNTDPVEYHFVADNPYLTASVTADQLVADGLEALRQGIFFWWLDIVVAHD